jgi:hypothetical protein
MSTNIAATETPSTPGSGTAPPASPYTAAAQAYMDQLRSMRPLIPDFAFAPEKPIRRKLIANASVPLELLEMVSVNLTNAPQIAVDGAEGEKIRDLMHRAMSFTAVADDLDHTSAAARHTVTDLRHQAGTIALDVYANAKRMAKKPGNADLIPLVEGMQRALGRTSPRPRKKAASAPTPTTGQTTPMSPVGSSHLSMETPQQTPPPTAETSSK